MFMRRKKSKLMKLYFFMYSFTIIIFFISCDNMNTALIWTDRPELALYAEYFNTVQNQYKVSVRFMESPVTELRRTNSPDIIIASWLKNSSTQANFKSLNNLFGARKLSRNIFYPLLLTFGRIDKNQYLLPVSFNIPALVFSRERTEELSNQFTIDFDEIKILSMNFNTESRGAYTRLGFSPLWNDNFLYAAAVLSGASFADADPLSWDHEALERSMDFIIAWTNEINTSLKADEDFTFKYFFEPPGKLIQSGRILFSFMDSKELFLLSEGSRKFIDFRWIMEQNNILLAEDIVYLGIPKWAKSDHAARAFINWLFKIENQRLLLEYFKFNGINENIFGICSGFSALISVTEQVFPLFYPELVGRMPPSEYFTEPVVMPRRWSAIKERVVLPYLSERARKNSVNEEEIVPLERRLSDWMLQYR